MQTTITVFLIIFAAVCLIAYWSLWSLWNAIDDIKESLDFIKRFCNNESEIRQSKYDLYELISKSHKELLTEIACLATKNNEDIKRMGGGYVVGDVLKFDGIEWYVFCKTKLDDGRTLWNLFGQNGAEYRIYTDTIPEDIEFVRHVGVESLFS